MTADGYIVKDPPRVTRIARNVAEFVALALLTFWFLVAISAK